MRGWAWGCLAQDIISEQPRNPNTSLLLTTQHVADRHDIRRGQARGRTDPGPGIGGANAAAVERHRQLWVAKLVPARRQ